MNDDSAFVARVDAVLSDTIRTQRAHWSRVDPALDSVFAEIERLLLGGGKRLRPRFCRWGWIAAGGDPASDDVARLGAGIELLHVCALFHDDVIDDADVRRGAPATHRRFADLHRENGWAGESRRFGEGAAILLGDLVFVMADMMLDGANDEARALWHELRLEVNIGQYLDVLGGARRERDPDAAARICRYKSAKYTVERPLQLGAIAADPAIGLALSPMLSAYGIPLGEAFQMRDDVLGAFGDSSSTGKPVGGDFREGKPTPMLAHAHAAADAAQRAVLDLVGEPGLDDSDIARIREVVTATGALAAAEERIVALRDEALSALDPARLAGDAHRALVDLAVEVTSRDA